MHKVFVLTEEGDIVAVFSSKELGVKETEGFYIKRVNKNTGAEKSGLIKGDIIKKIDSQNVTSYAELNGYISTKRPNDQVQVTIIRNNKTLTIPVTLTKSDVINTQFKGLELENIGAADKKKFRISYGVKIKEIDNEFYQISVPINWTIKKLEIIDVLGRTI